MIIVVATSRWGSSLDSDLGIICLGLHFGLRLGVGDGFRLDALVPGSGDPGESDENFEV